MRVLAGIWTVVFGLLALATTVPAGTAMSNLASWAQLLNLPIAHALTKTTDLISQWISYAALAVAALYYAILIYENRGPIMAWLRSWRPK
jgi:hypothetical protein